MWLISTLKLQQLPGSLRRVAGKARRAAHGKRDDADLKMQASMHSCLISYFGSSSVPVTLVCPLGYSPQKINTHTFLEEIMVWDLDWDPKGLNWFQALFFLPVWKILRHTSVNSVIMDLILTVARKPGLIFFWGAFQVQDHRERHHFGVG